jgi:hypothetical protein
MGEYLRQQTPEIARADPAGCCGEKSALQLSKPRLV